MKKSELTKTRFLIIILGVILAIIISIQTSAFSFDGLNKTDKLKAMTQSPKHVITHVHNHIVQVIFTTLKR